MVRSAHSRAIAISTRWTPAGWPVGRSRATSWTRPVASCTAVWPIASIWSIAPRSAVGPVPGSSGPLAILHVKSGGGELSAIEFLEQGLERDDFTRGNSARQHGAQFLPYRFLSIVCASLGPVKIERGESPARQLPEPRDLARCSEDHDLNRLRLGDALQLPRSHWRLIKDHRVRWNVPHIATRHRHRLIVVVVTKSSHDASSLSGCGLVASYDHSRGRIEIIQESPQGTGSGISGDGDVLDDRHLVIGGNLWRLDIRDAHTSGAAGVALGQIFHHWRQLAGNDDAP